MAGKKSFFKEVNLRADFPQMEKDLLDDWYKKNGVHKKYLSRNDNSKKTFSLLDGPITANNPMGVHHAWGRTYKDLWPRYKNMRGFKQRFQNGFDCQGLWVEVEVEKELGLKNKKDIEKLGIDKFIELCKERVYKFAKIQTEQSRRLGYFADWDNSYYTLSNDNNYMIWHFLKKCHEKNLIYKGRDSVPWCPRCGTAISQHEMLTEDYKQVTHQSVYFQLPLTGKKNEYLLVWTTTPWTVPANIAVAVNEKLEYSLVEVDSGDKYWVAKEAVERVVSGGKILKTIKGSALVGLKYEAPFDDLPAVSKTKKESENFHTVVATDKLIMPIIGSEGTGMVHTATGAGSEDFKLGKKLGLPVLEVIEEDANYMEGFGFLSGKNAKKNPRLILDYLEENNWVFKIEKYKHRYPACWRCKEELVWRVVDEWYIAIDPVRNDMKKIAGGIHWIPGFGKKRELDWLNNMHDWLISKKRYWGLALPIWECPKGHFEVIGGEGELKKRAIEGWSEFEGKSPHRPWVDNVKIKCSECGEKSSRIPDVGNPWLDAGIVTYSTISEDNRAASKDNHKDGKPLYLKNKKAWEKWAPADFITESFPGQFKNWFYALIAMSTVLENKAPFKTVLGFESLLAENGKAMHKSWGNSIEFNEGADKIGVDVMRWMYIRQRPEDNLLFGYGKADEVRRRFFLKIWNSYNFFVTYSNLASWKPQKNSKGQTLSSKSVLDRWIQARLNQTVGEVTEKLDAYIAHDVAFAIEEFVEDLSNWYIRRSRSRTTENEFFSTLYFVLVNLSKILAPLMPFVSEEMYRNLTKEESVHLIDWPVSLGGSKLKTQDLKIIEEMKLVRDVVERGHAIRKEKQIPVRQPLAKIYVKNTKHKIDDYRELIRDELNVKKCEIATGKGQLQVELELEITPDLEAEGEARKLIRQIQIERRQMGTGLNDEVKVFLPDWPVKFEGEIKNKALIKVLTKGKFKVEKLV